MDLAKKVSTIITPTLESMGLSLVQVHLKKGGKWVLEVTIERLDDAPVTMDDCVDASHEISALLDVEDPIERSYNLEVSSPGLDRPLLSAQDFKRFSGEMIKLKTFAPVEERRKFRGVLLGIDQDVVRLHDAGVDFCFELSNIASARLDPELDFKRH